MLTPVSFKKGREVQPRLSAPHTPGRTVDRIWSEGERDILRQHYSEHGPAYCLSLLPGRTMTGVYQRARILGLKIRDRTKWQKIGTSLDDVIKERWPGMSGRGEVAKLANELGVGRHAISARALALGLTNPHKKEPPWTEAEDNLLKSAPVNNPRAAAEYFAAHGFRRTPTAIMVRCKRKKVSLRRADVLSAHGASRILGVDSKAMAAWCVEGLVTAERRGTQRLSQQGGDIWAIKPRELRRFIIQHLERIDIRKVDKFAFVDLLTAPGEDPA